MFDVIVLDLVTPTIVKMMDFAGNFSAVLKIEGFIDLRKTSFA